MRPDHLKRLPRRLPARWRSPGAWPFQLLALFGVAWGWRLFYLHRLEHSQLWGSLCADSKTYWDWAGFLLRNGPLGQNPFFMGPLYPYLLALLRLFVGDSMAGVLFIQSVWGAAAVVLLADAARRLTRPAVGLAVGLLAAGYEMSVFFDGLVLMESLLFFIASSLLWVIAREDWKAPRPMTLAAVGVLIGLLGQGRAISVALLVPVALLLRECSPTVGQVIRRGGLVLVAFVLVCVPAALRNYAVSGEWMPFTYNFGLNLYIGNNPAATGSYVDFTVGNYAPIGEPRPLEDGGTEGDGRTYVAAVEGLRLGPSESSRYWAGRALTHVREQPAHAGLLILRKLGMMWNWREYRQLEDPGVFRAVLGPIGLPGVGTFGFLGALAVAGSLVAWSARGVGRFTLGYTAAVTLAILPFFVVDRYRHQLLPGAILLAGFAIEEMIRLAGRSTAPRYARFGTSMACGVALIALPLPGLDAQRLAWNSASDLGDRWLSRGRPDLALVEYQRAIAIDQAGELIGAESRAGRDARAETWANHGISLLLLGRDEEAVTSCERAWQLAPGAPLLAITLAEAHAAAGHLDEALRRCAEAEVGSAWMARDLARKAMVASRAGAGEGMARLLSAAISLDSTGIGSTLAPIHASVIAGRLKEARGALASALTQPPNQ